MSLKLQIIVIILVLIFLIFLFHLIKKNKLELRYALVWIFMGVGILTLAVFPSLMEVIAFEFGIENPINMLFFLGFCFSLVIIFSLTMVISKQVNKIEKMAQRIALDNKIKQEVNKEK